MTWKLIEDGAPKDGSVILGAWQTSDGWAVYPVLWRKSKMYHHLFGWHMINWPDMELQLTVAPTHWCAMPPFPESKSV